ncbi:MAG TPA: DUF4126 family protein [Pyrinomonadaceae bacterium]|nr:DUF4126 family protein [Pyrinomonadaceae bacterium]
MNLVQILGLALGSAWTSGINLYATVAVLGLLQHYKLAQLPGGLQVLDNRAVIGLAIGLYVVEFFADKIPYFDTVWDAVHTFVRVPAGAVLAYAATSDVSPTVQVVALLLGGGLALSTHGTKATVRAAANTSPEPVTNWALSLIEDVVAVGAAVLAVFHPLVILVVIAVFLLFLVWFLPKVVRRLRRLLAALRGLFGKRAAALLLLTLTAPAAEVRAQAARPSPFVTVEGHSFRLNDRPLYYVGTNYWYGSLLGLEKDRRRGVERLRRELDFLKSQGVTNLRLLAGAEGSGLINGVQRVGPPLQPRRGEFDEGVLAGLDLVLAEMGKRGLRAVVFLSNNWEWSGGFQQYLDWNGRVPEALRTRKLTWDEQRDLVSQFYACEPCTEGYKEQVALVVGRTNRVSGRRYAEDPTVMAWELANEPRPMRPAAADAYKRWVRDAAAFIKSKDRRHLVTVGHEGYMGTDDLKLFEEIHADPNVDYLTVHIWPKNWGWFKGHEVEKDFPSVVEKTLAYVAEHVPVAERLDKPLVIEEFGLPRDGHSFDPAAPTTMRDALYAKLLAVVQEHAAAGGHVAGANFWAFGGTARPVRGQTFWKRGDDYMGDPPMEEQGLNTVFDSDASTWAVIRAAAKSLDAAPGAAVGERRAVPVITRRVRPEATRDSRLEAAIRAALEEGGDDARTRYYYNRVDLDGDGRPEVLAYVFGPGWCGSAGCLALVFRRAGAGYKLVSFIAGAENPVVVSSRVTNGWRDLIAYVRWGEVEGRTVRDYYAVLRFDGRTYPEQFPGSPPLADTEKPVGVAYLNGDQSARSGLRLLPRRR